MRFFGMSFSEAFLTLWHHPEWIMCSAVCLYVVLCVFFSRKGVSHD